MAMSRPMTAVLVALLGLSSAVILAVPPQDSSVVIDGKPDDPFWQEVVPATLAPAEAGVPPETGGEIRAAVAGRYLYLGARLPEPDGRVTARSIGRNPVWEGGEQAREADSPRQYSYGAAEGEDFLRVVIRVYNENDWRLQIGPLGAYSVESRWTGEREWYTPAPEKCDRFLIAAAIGEREWSVEVAIPLDQLGSPAPGSVRLSVERNRAPRPGQPGQRWRWPEHQPTAVAPVVLADDRKLLHPILQPLAPREPPLEVGRRDNLPPLAIRWSDPAWRDVPVWVLRRNAATARLPNFPTEVKLLHNAHTLAVMARCIEPDRIVARALEGDRGFEQDDSFQVYMATSGSSYVHYAINPSGFILDAAGHSGGPRISRPYADWNSPARGTARQEQGEWFARMDLPLDSIARILGEARVPTEWRVLLLRSRPGRDGEPQETSVLPVTESVTPLCPARYRWIRLVDSDPSELRGAPVAEPTGNLAFLPSRVLSFEQRKEMGLAAMLSRNIRGRVLKVLLAEKRDWDRVQTLDDWERFRDPRLKALAASLGRFPPRCPLQTRVTKEFRGEGYRRQDLIYQSQPALWVTANLYLPDQRQGQMPGIIIVHSLHGPKTQFELQDMGILWARAGCAVLIMDQIGYGERIESYPWDRENYHSRYITGEQLYLVGESLITWMVWDIMRGVDLLLERKDINPKQIILLGAVAGGGDPAAVTSALDQRIAAVVPFNFGESTPEIPRFLPEKNQWPLEVADPGLDDWDSTRCLRRAIADEFLQWFVCASVAPRRFVYAYELGWKVEDLPAWARYRKVFGLYHAFDHLADAHGFGPFPGPGECWNIGPAQRHSLYPTLERWFGIPNPFTEAQSSIYDNLAKRPTIDRRPESELDVLTPALASELRRQSVHELAHAEGRAKLEAARAQSGRLRLTERQEWLRSRWGQRLGDIGPTPHFEAALRWTKHAPDATVEGITLTVEPDVVVPLLLLRPKAAPGARSAVVVAVAEAGKGLFLTHRASEIEGLLKRGVAVCLPDVRGTGETSPDSRRDPDSEEIMQANNELLLGETLLGRRLKDLRSVLSYLKARQDLVAQRIGLWGDSFSPANPDRLTLDEFPQWAVSPVIEEQAEPLGGLLALLGALYEDRVRAIAIRGGLASFLSILEDRFAYMPADVIVPGILEAGDIADVAAALVPRPLLLEGLVDGRNRLVPEAVLRRELDPLYKAYAETSPAELTIRSGPAATNFAEWFLTRLSDE